MGFWDYILLAAGGFSAAMLLVAAYDETMNSSAYLNMKHYHEPLYKNRQEVKLRYLLTLLVCTVFFMVRLSK